MKAAPSILIAAVTVAGAGATTFGQSAAPPSPDTARQWNQFRGPTGDGRTPATDVPIVFGEGQLVRWKTPIHDEGWSSPVVWGDTHVAWSESRGSPEIPSPIVVDDLLYMVSDTGGVVTALDATTGERVWRARLPSGGDHWASPVAAEGRIYLTSRDGTVSVISASREFELLAENEFDESLTASPAVVDGAIILRSEGHLYRISGEEAEGHAHFDEQIVVLGSRAHARSVTESQVPIDAIPVAVAGHHAHRGRARAALAGHHAGAARRSARFAVQPGDALGVEWRVLLRAVELPLVTAATGPRG